MAAVVTTMTNSKISLQLKTDHPRTAHTDTDKRVERNTHPRCRQSSDDVDMPSF